MYPKTFLLLLLISTSTPHPLPEEEQSTEEQITDTTPEPASSSLSLSLSVLEDPPESNDDDNAEKQKRHRPTPSPEEIEERRQALIKALGGGGDDEDGGGGGGQISASIMGLGSLATDVVSLIGSNANETFAPLREARQRARENFPDFGTQLNRVLKNGREYTMRAYRGILKNARVKATNALRFMLSAVTRLTSTIGGLYQVLVSLLDVATRGIGTGARVGSRLLIRGSNATVNAIAKGTVALRNLADSGDLVKPINQAVMVGRGLASGLSEDLFDKVEWTQEGINSKLELLQSVAPNFLLRAHESTSTTTESPLISPPYSAPPSDPILGGYGDDDQLGGYSKLTSNDDENVLLQLASTAAELMQRGGRNVNMTGMDMGLSTSSTTEESGPPQNLLNDIFGLQDDIDEIKSTEATSTTESSSSTVKS